ncbi:MAG: 2-dehydropantoate 2-reductase [Tepidisphaeraceae bacterium]|jgi:2-dehydropantoate 2-reductase
MSLDNPIIAVIGAGAVGGYYGARLAQGGFRVHLHMRSNAPFVRQNGMHIQSRDGDFSLTPGQISVHERTQTMPKADLVVVTLKTTANDQLADLLMPVVKEDSAILTLQNGLGNEQIIADRFGKERVLGGMAFVCINRLSPGRIAHTDHGMIQLGEFGSAEVDSPRARHIAQIFAGCKIPCATLPNLIYGRWEKLLWNIPFNGLGALLDLSTDHLLAIEDGLAMVRKLMGEVDRAAAKLGVNFPPDLIDRKIDYTRSMGAYRTSTQIDRQKNRPLEVESIWGEPLRQAVAVGVATPYLEMLYHALRLINRINQF